MRSGVGTVGWVQRLAAAGLQRRPPVHTKRGRGLRLGELWEEGKGRGV